MKKILITMSVLMLSLMVSSAQEVNPEKDYT